MDSRQYIRLINEELDINTACNLLNKVSSHPLSEEYTHFRIISAPDKRYWSIVAPSFKKICNLVGEKIPVSAVNSTRGKTVIYNRAGTIGRNRPGRPSVRCLRFKYKGDVYIIPSGFVEYIKK